MSMQDYFKEFFEKQGRKYIKEIVAQKRNHVVFDFDELMNWDSTVTNILIESPERGAFEEFRQAMIDAIAIESSNQIDGNDIEIGFIDNKSVPLVKLHNIGAKHVGKIIKVRGLVNRLSFVRPMYLNVVFKCRECGKTTSPILQESPLALTLPSKGCCSKNKLFDPVESLSSAIDSQEFALQELHEDVTSRVPQRTRMFIKLQYLINRVNCGDEVEVIGLVKLTSMYKQHVKSRFNEIYLEVLGIDKKSKDPETLEITPEEELEIQELANKPNIYQILIDNVAPSIFGHRDLKEACLLSLFGGVDRQREINIRGNIHVLFVGDPSTSKSQLLRATAELSPRGMYSSGQGVTAAGLTAAMNKDDSGEWMIEAGVLVLSDNGVACIDEIDKMRKEDRVNIHEAMEQQIVSINKAGIHATLKARTSVIAAANPLSGKYDPSKTVVENLSSFPPTLFSRFDLIFIVIDKPNEDLDTKVIEHIWGDGEEKEKVKLDRELFKKYIAYAKRIKPEVSPEARKILNNYFLSIRKHMQNNGESDTIPIYFRQFEALRRVCEAHARILLKPIADESDAEATKKIFNSFLESVRFDMEVIETGKSPKDAELQILEIIREHQGSDHTI
jgi:replicative DNA helicase Mcm